MSFDYTIDESKDTFDAPLEGVKAFNKRAVGIDDTRRFNVALSDEAGRMAGGVAAALRRGASDACLYTMSWQARPFYEKLGYECIRKMPYLGGHHRRYFMRKKL